jgi:diacylglycerol kinase family enzyme
MADININRGKSPRQPLRAKLIFNTIAGHAEESPAQLTQILIEMQGQQIMPEVFIVQPDSNVGAIVRRAIRDGTRLIVVAGGDGTVEAVATTMVGSPVTLGIIPTGTRNNLALNLGIPLTIPEAVAILRTGTPLRIDVGKASANGKRRYFLELVTFGLLSDLYPVADQFQHGDIGRIGELVTTFVSATPNQIQLTLDDNEKIKAIAHLVLVANMPYIGPNFQIDPEVSFRDGSLDIFMLPDASKFHLISFALRSLAGSVDQATIQHFRAKQLRLKSKPRMAIIADGLDLGSAAAKIEIVPRALTVMAGSTRGRGPTQAAVARRKQNNA